MDGAGVGAGVGISVTTSTVGSAISVTVTAKSLRPVAAATFSLMTVVRRLGVMLVTELRMESPLTCRPAEAGTATTYSTMTEPADAKLRKAWSRLATFKDTVMYCAGMPISCEILAPMAVETLGSLTKASGSATFIVKVPVARTSLTTGTPGGDGVGANVMVTGDGVGAGVGAGVV